MTRAVPAVRLTAAHGVFTLGRALGDTVPSTAR